MKACIGAVPRGKFQDTAETETVSHKLQNLKWKPPILLDV